jgi:osmotically-inducible protein OsmY
MQGTRTPITLVGLSTLFAAAALVSGCNREDYPRTSAAGDSVVAKADNVADKTATKTKDMAITAEVKTKLARDDRLSALSINVDTDAGKVTLRGKAPDGAAREQATTLAQSVSGVVGVDNQLTVQ